MGYFSIDFDIDGVTYDSKFHVASDDNMGSNEGILGLEFLQDHDIIINDEGVKILKKKKTSTIDDELQENIFRIHVEEENELDIGTVSDNVKRQIQDVVLNYFPEKRKSTNVEMKIILKDEEPIYTSPRRLPYFEREIVDSQVEKWIEDGVVEPCTSDYASPVVVTKKKDNSPRVCIDYRRINLKVIKDRFPLPLIEDQLDKLQDSKIFSTLDLKNGFFHVSVEESSRKYTSFVTYQGQYQFLKVPFGLCNSPAVFQRFINVIFRDLSNQGIVLPYMDDLIIPAANEEEALERLETVLERAKEYGLDINKKKCQFVKNSVEFLGHQIEEGKLYPSKLKTKAVLNFPSPTTCKHIQSFLGLTGYFRKFIPFYSLIARPLSDLLKKDAKFRFEEKEIQAFNKLKQMLADRPVLTIYRQGADIEVHTDASKDGYGAILLQRALEDNLFHPVYYFSKKTTDAEKKYSSYELEVLAIIQALKKLRVYLLGQHFKIITDCSAFQKTMSKKELPTRIARWALLLEDFDYVIEHRSGSRMQHVDALSRYPIMTITENAFIEQIKRQQDEDREVKAIKEILKDKPYDSYVLKNDILYKTCDDEELLVVPKQLQNEIIRKAHEEGHFSIRKTEDSIKREYYIPNLKDKLAKVINACVPCILTNRKKGKQEGFLHPLHKDSYPLQTLHIDHLGPLESTNKNYNHILAIVDSFTKFVWLFPTKSTTSREVISKLEIHKKHFGNPVNIISDRGTAFTAQDFEDYCNENDIKHHLITTGLPRANGQVERVNSVIISVLSKLSIDDPSKWYKHIDEVQRVINSTYHRSINTTPFELLIGVQMKNKPEVKIKTLLEEEMQHQFEDAREDLRREAKKQLLKVQDENRKTYNLRRKTPTKYRINELVAIKRTQFGPGSKLKPKFFGPYKVVRVKGGDTYDVIKEGFHDGPMKTTTTAEFMKPWIYDVSSGSDDEQDGRMWESPIPRRGVGGYRQSKDANGPAAWRRL